jgi:ribosomal protein S18 acetylase RimI-like enzyme
MHLVRGLLTALGIKQVKLIGAKIDQLAEIMTWFPDRRSCLIWGGSQFRFPFTKATFSEDVRLDVLASYALVGSTDELLGFGQYYLRADRCHLGRLAIAPGHRGQGIGSWLVGGLVQLGSKVLCVDECSLFVLADNLPAIRLYEKLGFVYASYPEKDFDVAGIEYMVAPVDALERWELGAQQTLAGDAFKATRAPEA